MAIRRYTKASDNAPAWGYAVIDEIQGTGVFKLPVEWTRAPQDGIVCFAQAFNLPPEFVPTGGSRLYILSRTAPGGIIYDIGTCTIPSATTGVSVIENATVITPNDQIIIPPQAWYYITTGLPTSPSRIELYTKEFTGEATLYAITHTSQVVKAPMVYFGAGDDVSASHGLATGTRWSIGISMPEDANIAEMVFVDGEQIVGDTYDYYQSYGGGAYDMFRMDDGTIEIQLVDPVNVSTTTLFFALFRRYAEPRINIRFEDPLDEDGVWIEYFDIPKGDIVISYYIN